MVCGSGFGSSDGESTTMWPSVVRKQQTGFANRACQAKLIWNKQEMLIVPGAWQVGVDLMGANMGFKTPVMALQIKRTDADPLMR